jgi:hypothetical protein
MWGRFNQLKQNATAGLGALRGAAQQLGRELVADVEEEERERQREVTYYLSVHQSGRHLINALIDCMIASCNSHQLWR